MRIESNVRVLLAKQLASALAMILVSGTVAAQPVLENSIWNIAAKSAGLNVHTLYGIAMQESGMRWRDGTYRPWPWTLNINNGKGIVKSGPRRYPDKL